MKDSKDIVEEPIPVKSDAKALRLAKSKSVGRNGYLKKNSMRRNGNRND